MDSVASMPRWAVATTESAVGSVTPAVRTHTNAVPQATSPSDAAARNASGTEGGGTPPGTPAGRPFQEAVGGGPDTWGDLAVMVATGQEAGHHRRRTMSVMFASL
jgi:hypothetical protein